MNAFTLLVIYLVGINAAGLLLTGIDKRRAKRLAYRIPEAEKERFDAVTRCVRDSDWEGLKKVLGD